MYLTPPPSYSVTGKLQPLVSRLGTAVQQGVSQGAGLHVLSDSF